MGHAVPSTIIRRLQFVAHRCDTLQGDDLSPACPYRHADGDPDRSAEGDRPASTFLTVAQWTSIGLVLRLSPREEEIARHIVDGDDEVHVAHQLGISRHTVHTHIERLYRKLGVNSRCQLVVRLFEAHVLVERRRYISA